jgi:hypothetical protein
MIAAENFRGAIRYCSYEEYVPENNAQNLTARKTHKYMM